jgi:ribosome biogenesis GTPase
MQKGLIIRSTGSWYDVEIDGEAKKARLRGKLRLGSDHYTNPVAVGDIAHLEDGGDGTFLITGVSERENVFIRQAAGRADKSQIIAANVDVAITVQSLRKPSYKFGFIDRFLVTCEAYGIEPIIVINKADLADAKTDYDVTLLKEIYESLDYSLVFCSALTGDGMPELQQKIDGKLSVLTGQSGVGKSSIINYLAPALERTTNQVSDFNEKGKHTTTFAEMLSVNESTKIIDTPGIREFGISNFEPHELSWYFREMSELKQECRFRECLCQDEPGCPVIASFEEGTIHPQRMNSYYNILESLLEQNT